MDDRDGKADTGQWDEMGLLRRERDLTEQRAAFERLRESEERYRMLFEHVPAALVITRADGTILACNAYALDMTGFTRQEVIGTNIVGFHPLPEDRERLRTALQHDWPRAGPVEVLVRTRDGEDRLVSLSMARMRLHGEDVVVGMGSDLTKRRRHERMLEKTTAELRQLADNAPAPILRLDLEFRILFANRRLVEVIGRSLEEIIGSTARELGMPEDLCDRWEQAQLRARATGERQVLEFCLPTPSGVRHYSETIVAETGPDGQPVGVLTVARDVTEEVKAREALEVEHAALKQSHIALQELAARIDQEKREVGQAVQRNVEHAVLPILESLAEELAPDQRSYVDMIRNALTDVASPFADHLASQLDSLSPAELRVAALVRNRLTSKQIAQLLGISVSTVHRHRESIRRKLKLTGKAANLVTFLDTLLDSEQTDGLENPRRDQ
jgi:PAS domain S-box-containing protein